MSENVEEENITFGDDSQYRGQVLRQKGEPQPCGFGQLMTKEGFQMRGYFIDGKAQGRGRFLAPNGDLFYGNWNETHKRHGPGLSRRADGTRRIEKYDNGKLLKRIKPTKPKPGKIAWDFDFNEKDFEGDVPMPRSDHTATLMFDGKMLIMFGGQAVNEQGRLEATDKLYILDVANKSWTSPQFSRTPPPPMYGHTATAYGNLLVIIGGQVGFEVSSAVYVLDVSTGEWSCPIQKGINMINHTASLIGDEIFVIVQGTVFVLDLNEWVWSQPKVDKRALGLRRNMSTIVSHSAAAFGPMIVVIGGKMLGTKQSGKGKQYIKCSADVTIFHADQMAWEVPDVRYPEVKRQVDYSGVKRGAPDLPRSEHTAVAIDKYVYVFGGYSTSNPKMNVIDQCFLDDVQVLDVETMEWITPTINYPITPPRAGHSSTIVGDQIWVFGGINPACQVMSEWCALNIGDEPRLSVRAPKAEKTEEKEPSPASDPSGSVMGLMSELNIKPQ